MGGYHARKVRDMMPLQRAWVAGLLEGEGSFLVVGTRNVSRGRVSIQMTDRDVVERLAAIVGTGSIGTVGPRGGRKTIYQWRVQGRADVLALIDQVEPFMGHRRTAAIQLMRFAMSTGQPFDEHRGKYPKIKPGWTTENGHAASVEPDLVLSGNAALVGVDEVQPLTGLRR